MKGDWYRHMPEDSYEMSLGTKTLLFGVHQIFIHPFLVTIAWIILYKSLPNLRELICIFIHDWGYWGKKDLKGADGDTHPELGAKIALFIFGEKYKQFILGHSTFYTCRNDIEVSKLMAPDKYWHCIVPYWVYALLSIPTGEMKHYREMKHARQVCDDSESNKVWFLKLQKICMEKVNGTYEIKKELLADKED